MLQAVCFDFYGTLIRWRQHLEPTVRKVAARYGLALDWERYQDARKHVTAAYDACTPDRGTAAMIERLIAGYQDFLRELGAREHLDQLAWEIAQYDHAFFSPANAVLYPEVVPALAALRGKGLRLGVVSNFHVPLHNLLEEVGIESYFDVVIASHDSRVRCEKPQARIFELALAALTVAPAHALHVGDDYQADVLGAHGAGLHAVFLDREGLHPGLWPRTIASLEALPELVRAIANDSGGQA
jgi:putative hydrolase of the HAD superfamily